MLKDIVWDWDEYTIHMQCFPQYTKCLDIELQRKWAGSMALI